MPSDLHIHLPNHTTLWLNTGIQMLLFRWKWHLEEHRKCHVVYAHA